MSKDTVHKEILRVRKLCIDNAKDLVNAAKKTLNHPHISYHLATLALEEIGKMHILEAKIIAGEYKEGMEESSTFIDNHIKKLFWAFFGVSPKSQNFTKEEIDFLIGLAGTVHKTRLESLYVDPESEIPSKDKVTLDEAKQLVGMANV